MTDKKCAIITGLAAGVGAAVALELGERGYNVLINYNKSESEAEQTQAAVDKAGGNAIVVQGDVADDAACVAMAKAAMSEWGRLDVLVNRRYDQLHRSRQLGGSLQRCVLVHGAPR